MVFSRCLVLFLVGLAHTEAVTRLRVASEVGQKYPTDLRPKTDIPVNGPYAAVQGKKQVNGDHGSEVLPESVDRDGDLHANGKGSVFLALSGLVGKPTAEVPYPWDCILIGVLGSLVSSAGVVTIWMMVGQRREAALMTGDDLSHSAATITSKRDFTTKSKDSHGHVTKTRHYVVSYSFEAVRDGGMRCQVDVADREQPKAVWSSLQAGKTVEVSYLAEDPGHCRLAAAAVADVALTSGFCFYGTVFVGSMFILAGFFVGVCLPLWVFSAPTGLLCAAVWIGGVGLCWITRSNGRGSNASIKELGFQEPHVDLGDISGTWLMELEVVESLDIPKKYEYQLDIETEQQLQERYKFNGDCDYVIAFQIKKWVAGGGRGAVKIKGRVEGESTWSPECLGHFMNGHTLQWHDETGTTFVARFTSPKSFEGSATSAEKDFSGTFKASR